MLIPQSTMMIPSKILLSRVKKSSTWWYLANLASIFSSMTLTCADTILCRVTNKMTLMVDCYRQYLIFIIAMHNKYDCWPCEGWQWWGSQTRPCQGGSEGSGGVKRQGLVMFILFKNVYQALAHNVSNVYQNRSWLFTMLTTSGLSLTTGLLICKANGKWSSSRHQNRGWKWPCPLTLV